MPNYFALIPAAGLGARMGRDLPKQYLPLRGQPMLYHALKRLCETSQISHVYVVLAPQDHYWAEYDWQEFSSQLTPLFCGGETRSESVLNGLTGMHSTVSADDWVLVHDAARPCLSAVHLAKLIAEVGDDQVGGLLAMPVADTLKRADGARRVVQTEPRASLWQAQTPQMFRYALLKKALEAVQGDTPTDESRALEQLGYHPKLVESDSCNLKVTYPQDLELAKLILAHMT